MLSRKDYALHYYQHGFIPIPLCWAEHGKCVCGRNHTKEKEIGKARLVKQPKEEITLEMVMKWFTDFPEANIGLLVHESGLVIVDCDSAEAIEEFESKYPTAMYPTATVKTGIGHHYYFRANPDTPKHRAIQTGKSGKIDIFSNGYIVAPPSIHKNGYQYVWLNQPKKTGLRIVPNWIENFLVQESAKKINMAEIEIHIDKNQKVNLDELPLTPYVKSIIKYGEASPYYRQRGYRSRSHALHSTIISCYEKGLSNEEIFSIFSNPRYAMSYKYLENKRSDKWLTDEMKRAKGNFEKRTKKNSRTHNTTTHSHINPIAERIHQ